MEQFRRRRVQTLENTCLLQCSFSKVPVLFLEIILMECDQNTHKKYPECMINQFGAVWESTILSRTRLLKDCSFFMKNCSSRLYMMLQALKSAGTDTGFNIMSKGAFYDQKSNGTFFSQPTPEILIFTIQYLAIRKNTSTDHILYKNMKYSSFKAHFCVFCHFPEIQIQPLKKN